MQRQSSYKVHMNTISNGELSDPLCDSVNRGLTLVRLVFILEWNSLIFVLREMVPVLQMVPITLNAVLALPIIVLISNSEPPVLFTALPRYVKLCTSSSAVELTFKLAWLLVLAFNTGLLRAYD